MDVRFEICVDTISIINDIPDSSWLMVCFMSDDT
jgi:hypothetical protein